MSDKLKQYKKSFWRIPLIAIIAGFFYTPFYVQIVIKFGVIAPGIIDDRITLMTSAGFLLLVLILGGFFLLRKQSRKEVFVSACIVSLYGILLTLIQIIVGNTTGFVAVVFMYLSRPLDWTGFFSELFSYLQNHFKISLPIIWWFRFFAPFFFVLFAQK